MIPALTNSALLFLSACGGPADPPNSTTSGDTGTTLSSPSSPSSPTDSEPDLTVDVLVIGSGPAGLSAAWEADQAGASVLVVERNETLGGAGSHARNLIAAGTRWQAAAGITDSPEQFLAEWASFTGGGDPTDPWVQTLAYDSADTLDWLVDQHGAVVFGLLNDPASGATPRLHEVGIGEEGPVGGLVSELQDLAWTSVEARTLRFDPDDPARVTGAWLTDLLTGETVEIAATATIIATGGFARDLDRVMAERPELEGALVLFEASPSSDGGGLPLLDQAGAALQNMEHHGVYVHSAPDPRAGLEGEALVLGNLESTVMVNSAGNRVANESTSFGFTLSNVLAAAPDKRLWAIYPAGVFDDSYLITMASELGLDGGMDPLTSSDLVKYGLAVHASSAEQLGKFTDVDGAGLSKTLARYAELVSLGEDLDFGKPADALLAMDGDLVAVELAGGSAKSFGGAWLDTQARVLDSDGQVIPGLYAAGEAAGMLGTPAIGMGFSGSVMACYLTGRVAGQHAAADALAVKASQREATRMLGSLP